MTETQMIIGAAIFVGIWVLFVWAGARLAENKGRPRLFGAVVAAVFPLFGLFILAIMRSRRDPRDRAQIVQPVPPEHRPE